MPELITPPTNQAAPLTEVRVRSRAETPAERRVIRAHILFVFAVLLTLGLAWKLLHVLELVYVSALFAVVLMPVVKKITTLKVSGWSPSRGLAIAALVLTVAFALAAFLFVGLPPVLHDLRDFGADLPARVPGMVAKMKRLPMADKFGVDSVAQRAEGLAASTASYLFASFPKLLEHVFDFATALFLCLYFMLEGEHAYAYFLAFFRPKARARLDRTLLVAEERMSRWLIGQGSLMLILGTCSTIVFGLLHVRYFFLLGVLMGLFNIIPVAGGAITILLAALVAALDSWTKMAGVFIFYAIYVQLENGYLTPRIMKSSVNLMGLTVIVALLVGTALAGVIGALVAVPTTALVAVLMDEYMVQKDPEAQAMAGEKPGPAAS